MKILFISPIYPFDKEYSRARVIKNYLKELSTKHRHKISLVCITNEDIDPKAIPEYIDNFDQIPQPPIVVQVANIFIYSILLQKYPIQSMLYSSNRNRKRIQSLTSKYHPDVVLTELIRTACLLPKGDFKRICDLADLFSKRYRHQLSNIEHVAKVQGQYTIKEKSILNLVLKNVLVKKLVLSLESKLITAYEKKLPYLFDIVTLVSPVEVKELQGISKSQNIRWLPNGTDPYVGELKKHVGNGKNILFLGVMDVPHNNEAVMFFIKNIYPRIKAIKKSDLSFRVIGKNPSEDILNEAKIDPSIKILGFVENLKKEFFTADIFVCPLVSGSGVQTKLFEAMKWGLPIVTTSLAAQGIKAKNSKLPFLIADDPENFAKACVELLNDSNKRQKYSEDANEIVTSHYFWPNAGKIFNEIILGK